MVSSSSSSSNGNDYYQPDRLRRLKTATEFYDSAWSLINNHLDEPSRFGDLWKSYDSAIDKFKIALEIRENLLGRYHKDTANVYIGIGYAYSQKHNKYAYGPKSKSDKFVDHAIAAYHTGFRIRRYLEYSTQSNENNSDSSTKLGLIFRSMLQAKGYSPEEIIHYERNIDRSIEFEMEGDMKRSNTAMESYNDENEAIKSYQNALVWENQLLTTTHQDGNPVNAMLRRKIALIVARRRTKHSSDDSFETRIDWNKADRSINDETWLKDLNNGLYQIACENIRQGDELYASFKYNEAINEYHQASTTMELVLLSTSSSMSEGQTSSQSSGATNSCDGIELDKVMERVVEKNNDFVMETVSKRMTEVQNDIVSSIEVLLAKKLSYLMKDDSKLKSFKLDHYNNITLSYMQAMLRPIMTSQIDTATQIKALHCRTESLAETVYLQNIVIFCMVLFAVLSLSLKYAFWGESSSTNRRRHSFPGLMRQARRQRRKAKMKCRRNNKRSMRHVSWDTNLVKLCNQEAPPLQNMTYDDQGEEVQIEEHRIDQVASSWDDDSYSSSSLEVPNNDGSDPTTANTLKQLVSAATSTSQTEATGDVELLIETCRMSTNSALERILQLTESGNAQQAKLELENFKRVEATFWEQLRDGMLVAVTATGIAQEEAEEGGTTVNDMGEVAEAAATGTNASLDDSDYEFVQNQSEMTDANPKQE